MTRRFVSATLALAGMLSASGTPASAQAPAAINEPDATIIAIYHAEGAQIYECNIDEDGRLAWQLREPIATLMSQGTTIGHHRRGPVWDFTDGSAIGARVTASAAPTSPGDLPWLKLNVTSRQGSSMLSRVDIVQRINTRGGVLAGPCDDAGAYSAMPYSADYTFLRRD